MIDLKTRPEIAADVKLSKLYTQFDRLLNELKKHRLTPSIEATINKDVEEINNLMLTGNE